MAKVVLHQTVNDQAPAGDRFAVLSMAAQRHHPYTYIAYMVYISLVVQTCIVFVTTAVSPTKLFSQNVYILN